MKKSMTFDEYLATLPTDQLKRIEEKSIALQLDYELKNLRQGLGLTQQEVATLMGISQPSVANLERKTADFKLSSLRRYFTALGVEATIQVVLPSGEIRQIKI